MKVKELETERLTLRQWAEDDRKPFAELNADPDVMEFFPKQLSQEESDASVEKYAKLISERGWGLWAVELKHTGKFIGSTGLHRPEAKLPFGECVEVGWRFSKEFWGNGYATEAASAALKFGFEVLGLKEIVSFTTLHNKKSESVMQRLKMTNVRQNFQHPSVAVGSELREHLLYKMTIEQWDQIFPRKK